MRTGGSTLVARGWRIGRHRNRAVVAVYVMVLFVALMPSRVFADPTIHTVQPGDTLSGLAWQYGTTVEAIAEANNLYNTSLIYRGQKLIIPDNTGEAGLYQPVSAVGARPTYVVQPGDTLIGIAVRFRTTVRELAVLNDLQHWNLIFAGRRLKLPTTSLGVDGRPVPPGLKRIEVDVSEQRLRVYEGNRLVWDWPASTGLPGYPTRYGRFQVLDKIPLAYSRPWKLWMPHWLGIYWAGGSENGIHSLPIINGRTLWAGYLGSRISFGCVVIGTDEGERLFSWADVGTTVDIHE